MAGRKKETGAAVEAQSVQHTKEQILASARYHNQRDLVEALLDSGKKYTVETVDKLINEFMKGKVN